MAIISRLPQGGEIDNKVPITLTLEGAKEDTITITDYNGEQVGECVFNSGCTSGTVDLMIFNGYEYTLSSGVSNYTKKVKLYKDESYYAEGVLQDIGMIPQMTSNTSPSGEAFSDKFDGVYLPWKAFDGIVSTDSNNDVWSAGPPPQLPTYIGYTFDSPTCVNNVSFTNGKTHFLYKFKVQGSNDKFVNDIHDLGEFNSTTVAFTKYSLSFDNENTYTSYRLYITETSANSANISNIQFYTKGIKVMPEGALYWYGNECFEKTGGWGKYNYVAKWIGSKTYDGLKYTNHMEVNDTTTNSDGAVYVGTSKKIDLTNYSECSFIGFIGRSPYTNPSNGICLVAEQSFGTSTGGMGDGIELDYSTSGSYKDCLTTPAHYSIESAYKREMYMTFYNGRDGVRGTKIVAIYLS